MHVRGDRDIAGIEQAMDVSPEQQAVAGLVVTTVAVWADVCGLERWQGALLADGAAAFINIGYHHAQGAVTQSRPEPI